LSRENVDLVRRAWEASVRHDNGTALALYAPDVEIHVLTQGAVDVPVVYRGLDGVREMYEGMLGVFADFATTVDEWIDAGDDVIAMLRVEGRGRKSGAPFEKLEAHVWTVREGKLWRLRIYPTRRDALEAVGLEG
jgi:ketosteroid isomerase-like protein